MQVVSGLLSLLWPGLYPQLLHEPQKFKLKSGWNLFPRYCLFTVSSLLLSLIFLINDFSLDLKAKAFLHYKILFPTGKG
jgi:hypothetical protein